MGRLPINEQPSLHNSELGIRNLECVNELRIPNSKFQVLGYQHVAPADCSLPTAADLTSSGERASTRATANREYRSVVSGFSRTRRARRSA
jgi:hypothetical protein